MFKLSIALVLAASIIAFAVGARAQGAPVTIADCSVIQWVHDVYHPYWRPFGPIPGGSPFTDGITIGFRNTSSKVATRVAFVVNYRGDIQHVIDVGTFSPNAMITHTFGQYTGEAWLGPKPNSCRVVAVRFSDGTVWHSPRRARPQTRQ